MLFRSKSEMVSEADALPGRTDQTMPLPTEHTVLHHPLTPPWPEGLSTAVFGLGCFWGAEKLFWQTPGVYSTAAGYAGGFTPNPSYEEVCSGRTGHAEVVLVVFDPAVVSYDDLLKTFWEDHDPTQGMRQGNDVGSQYRSAIYFTDPGQRELAETSRAMFATALAEAGYGEITTELKDLSAPGEPPGEPTCESGFVSAAESAEQAKHEPSRRAGVNSPLKPLAGFYYAEPYHQQYLDKNPAGYCPLHATGVSCRIPT